MFDASTAVVTSSSRTSKQSRRNIGEDIISLQCLSDFMLCSAKQWVVKLIRASTGCTSEKDGGGSKRRVVTLQ